jgi:hypothetical protein
VKPFSDVTRNSGLTDIYLSAHIILDLPKYAIFEALMAVTLKIIFPRV